MFPAKIQLPDSLLPNAAIRHSDRVLKSARLSPVLWPRPTVRMNVFSTFLRGGDGIHEVSGQRGGWKVSPTASCSMNSDERSKTARKFAGVVVGGTFDRLHEGHWFLLTTALETVTEGGHLLVGIATGPLLAKKLLSELIEPYEHRMHAVEQFLKCWARENSKALEISIIPITESAPPAATVDSTLECLVVSEDTEKGAQVFNDARVAAGLPPLTVLVVGSVSLQDGTKMSSSRRRTQLLGSYLPREKEERLGDGALITGPYVLGLTGGIATGKSFVRDLMKEKGVEVLDCDSLAHLSYIPGTPTYLAIVKAFGPTIVLADGLVDRRALSSIVFSDRQKMDILTAIVWPAVSALVSEAIEVMAEQRVRVCVAEAALLLEAQWEKEVHEVWVVFTPHKSACARLMSRNHLSEEEANKRIYCQMTSAERVARADVVIYNGWTQDETRQQVDKAWELLQKRLVLTEETNQQHPLWVRWGGLMRRLAVDLVIAKKWWHVLVTTYEAPNRNGHSLSRIQVLYKLFHQNAHFFFGFPRIQLAIFFHDVGYNPCSEEHEHKASSIMSFKDFAKEAKICRNDEMIVCEMILQTTNIDEAEAPDAPDGAPVLDESKYLRYLELLRRKQLNL